MAKADAAEHTVVEDITMTAAGQMRGRLLHRRTFGDTIQ